MSKILFLPRENKIHIFKPPCNVLFIIRHADDGVFWWFPEDFWPPAEDFRRNFKIVPKAGRTLPNIFRKFPKMPEDCRRLPKTFEEDSKMFRWYTNEFKYNLRDKLDINEIIDKLTCEIMENKPLGSRMYFLWILRVVYFSVKHPCLYNKVSYKELLDQSECRKLFAQLWNDTKTLYKPLEAVYIKFSRLATFAISASNHSEQLWMNFSFIWKTSL